MTKAPKDYGTNKISQQPARSYELPGGPTASALGKVEVKKLAEIARGGPDDRGFGSRR